jgi:transcription initiation factor TFIIH subunit 2
MKITVNIISLVGTTYVFKILTEKCNGKYESVHDEQSYYNTVTQLPLINHFDKDRVKIDLFKVGFCRREIMDDFVFCFCHMEEQLEIYVCSICKAILCKVPTICCMCKTQIILPGDLYRHYESN